MTAQMLPGILSGHSAPVPGVFLLFTVMPRLRITVYFSAFFLFFLLIFFCHQKRLRQKQCTAIYQDGILFYPVLNCGIFTV
ncbi:hypothetical protein B9086_016155 [Morganella morganii subsp. morganii]|nr:hypothetical protein AL531_05040 [Morganella morganii]AZP25933.1 hypothetical protein D8758_10710 [Morganella morganii]RAX27925.1 hypothetical protein DQ401_03805 [Morganella morganii]RDC70168.1 hypothetical protein DVJ80_01290 [Morganella morganii]RNW09068.1 hypothetical protein B9086_016155 [Morganella morganii subsp. morganii]